MYTRVNWQNAPSTATPVNAENLNTMDKGIADAHSQLADAVNQVGNAYESSFKASNSVKKAAPVATVVFCDDDGAPEVLSELKPFAISKGVPWTLAIMPNSPILLNNETELKELQDVYGWEVAAHNDVAVTTLTENELNTHAKNISSILRSKGFNVNNYIYPNGLYNDLTEQVLSKYFRSASSTGQTTHNRYDRMKMYELARSATPSLSYENRLETLKQRVDNAVAANGLLIFTTHIWNMEQRHLDELQELIDYIKSKGVRITTLNKALDDFAPLTQSKYFDEQDYFSLLRDGRLLSNRAKFKLAPENTFNANNTLADYEADMVTISAINTANATGLPNNKAGVVVTYRIGSSLPYSFQIYKEYGSNKLYVRSAISETQWRGWNEIQLDITPMHKVLATNSYNASTPIASFPDGITTFAIDSNNSTGTPGNYAGLITTYKIQGNGYHRQEFRRLNQNFIYTRFVDSSGAWTDWGSINVPLTGTTENRPSTTTVGTQYFDTTLGKPIWLKTSTGTWVDATGATV